MRLALLSTALAAMLVIPAAGAGVAAFGSTEESYVVDTRHGKIYVEVVRPVDGTRDVPGPAIFTYSPYSILGRNSDASRWVPRGYVRVWADVVGTGNSGGCWDYGGRREKETGYDLVEWIARQPWSTGKVGMIGGSYNGTTATATAVANPPHLTTVGPEAAISRWYEYAFSGGVRYFLNNESPTDEGVDTPLAFDFGLAIPPPLDVTDPSWGERVAATVRPCDEVAHTTHGYDDTPDYDTFWRDRDYVRDASKIDVPVLLAHNWGDWNVKQEEAINLYRALKNTPEKKLYLGTRYRGHGTPAGDYRAFVDAWFDRWLMGIPNGIENAPDVHSELSTYDGPAGWYAGGWPATTPVTLFAQEDAADADYRWKLLPRLPKSSGARSVASFVSTGTVAESVANANPRTNAGWLWFETPPLARDARVFGEIEVTLWSTIQRRWITYTPTIVDVDPAHRIAGPGQLVATDKRGLTSVTRGWLDTRYRKSLASQSFVTPGTSFGVTIVEKPQDYTFEAGHLIGLSVQTEIVEWSVPKPDPDCTSILCATVRIDWEKGQTRVVLPLVDAPSDPTRLFASG